MTDVGNIKLNPYTSCTQYTSSTGPGEVRLLDAFLGLENSGGTQGGQGEGDDEAGSDGEDEE